MSVDLVDVIFLDIDGVLLPFGGVRDGYRKDEGISHAKGCIFPDRTMRALETLLRRISDISLDRATTITPSVKNEASSEGAAIRGSPVLVLSSTWRARSEFVEDILSSFRAYARARREEYESASKIWEGHLESFFDVTDPNYHATRHDEIYRWVKNHVGEGKQFLQLQNCAGRKYTVRSWIALDDEDLVNVEGRVLSDGTKHAVRTKSSVGLTLDDINLGVCLVMKQMREFHAPS